MTDKLSALIETFKHQLENGNKIDPDAAREMLLAISIDTHTEVKHINGRLKKVEKVAEDVEESPSLLWLLKNKFSKVLAVVGVLWMGALLTMLFFFILHEAGILSNFLELLGLPSVMP